MIYHSQVLYTNHYTMEVVVLNTEISWLVDLWSLTPLQPFQLYRGDQFYWWRKPMYLEKSTDLS
jgi:hypothetical protein